MIEETKMTTEDKILEKLDLLQSDISNIKDVVKDIETKIHYFVQYRDIQRSETVRPETLKPKFFTGSLGKRYKNNIRG